MPFTPRATRVAATEMDSEDWIDSSLSLYMSAEAMRAVGGFQALGLASGFQQSRFCRVEGIQFRVPVEV